MPPSDYNLYHVTSYEVAMRILDGSGIDPEFSQGRRKVCWYVGKKNVAWAIAHTIQRKQITVEDIAILQVTTPKANVIKTNRAGIYGVAIVLYPHVLDSAEMWLAREERYIHIPGTSTNRGGWYGYNGKNKANLP